jgi:hypothetical protein
VQKAAGADNHYWDTEVYAAFVADKLGIRYMHKPVLEYKDKPAIKKNQPEDDWLKTGANWV